MVVWSPGVRIQFDLRDGAMDITCESGIESTAPNECALIQDATLLLSSVRVESYVVVSTARHVRCSNVNDPDTRGNGVPGIALASERRGSREKRTDAQRIDGTVKILTERSGIYLMKATSTDLLRPEIENTDTSGSTEKSWRPFWRAHSETRKTCIISTETEQITDKRTWNCGPHSNLQGNGLSKKLTGRRNYSCCMGKR